MNLRSDLALMLSGHASMPACLLFRQADGLRLDGCLTLLLKEGQNLALSSQADAALDHYADLLMHRLRRAAACPVDIYFPASTAALVARFEELVAGMTVQQAMTLEPDAAPERIWLVHEAGALAAGELQLLTRLVGNFPGAGVRVVLLFGASASGRKGFESPGRRFARWDIQPPSAEEAATMLEQARLEGGESVVRALMDQLRLTAPASPPLRADPMQVQAPAPLSAAPAAPAAPVALGPRAGRRGWPAAWQWPRWLRVGSLGRPAPGLAQTSEDNSEVQDVVDKRSPAPAALQLARLRAGLLHRVSLATQSLRSLRGHPAPTSTEPEQLPSTKSTTGPRP